MSDSTFVQGDFARETLPVNLEDEMRKSYLDYAMSVIVGRALPDVRDGLKPVHRRVLFAMNESGNDYNKAYRKSATAVGDTMGKYHPHGDSAIYDTIVRMAQPFSLRYMMIDGQGNFGSVDGDPPAAMRYTEIRMAKIAHEMMADIDKETVDFVPNYDGSKQEPTVLPAKVPSLLVNGSSGIAVGMATNIPPHNLSETIDASVALLDNDDLTIDELITYIPAPDFPTGATIFGIEGVRAAYKTGRGRVIMRSKTHMEPISGKGGDREAIIVDEIPYQVNKAKLCEKIGELVRDKQIEGISEMRDESDKSGMRVVIELKRGTNAEVVLNQLFKMTPLQDSFGINMVALVDGQPRVLNLKQILKEFLRHRREVVTRRTLFELRKARERGHILEGLAVALSNVDEMIELIKSSETPPIAKASLLARPWHSSLVAQMLERVADDVSRTQPENLNPQCGLKTDGYHLSEVQAQAILDMRLQRLTGLEQDKIINEYKDIMAVILDLIDILEKRERVDAIMRNELILIKEQYGDARRSTIDPIGGDDIADEDLIEPQEMMVTLSHAGYIKTQPVSDYRAQKRGGKGKKATTTKEEDFIETLFVANTHDYLMCFSNLGRCHWIKVYRLPEGSRNSRGRPIGNVLNLDKDEKVSAILPVRDFPEDEYVFFATANGMVKKVCLSAFKNVSNKGIKAIALKEDDSLIGAVRTQGKDDIMLFSDSGKAIRFNEYWEPNVAGDESYNHDIDDIDDLITRAEAIDSAQSTPRANGVRPSGRGSGGLRGMRLPHGTKVVSLLAASDNDTRQVLTATENGYGKRTPFANYSRKGKGGQGVIAIDTGDRNGKLVGAALVEEADDLMLITSGGVLIRTKVGQIRETGRAAQGVRLIGLNEGEKLVSMERVAESEEDENLEPDNTEV